MKEGSPGWSDVGPPRWTGSRSPGQDELRSIPCCRRQFPVVRDFPMILKPERMARLRIHRHHSLSGVRKTGLAVVSVFGLLGSAIFFATVVKSFWDEMRGVPSREAWLLMSCVLALIGIFQVILMRYFVRLLINAFADKKHARPTYK